MSFPGRTGTHLIARPNLVLYPLLLAGLLLWILLCPVTKVPLTIDEGSHLIGARHILLHQWYLNHPELTPGQDPRDWAQETQPLLGYPPTIFATFAASLAAFGLTPVAHGLPLLFCLLLTAFALWVLARRLLGPTGSLLAVTLLLWSRASVHQGTFIECEPFVVAFGTTALAVAVEGIFRGGLGWFAGAGALVGLAFLYKLWMVGPFLLILALLLVGPARQRLGWSRMLRRAAAMGAAFAAVGGAHLGYTAMTSGSDLQLWLSVYLLPFRGSFPAWATRPVWFYGAVLYRDFCIALLPLLLALGQIWHHRRDGRLESQIMRWLLVGVAASLVLFSLLPRKELLYAYPFEVPLILLVAAGMEQKPSDPTLVGRLSLPVAVLGLVAVVLVAFGAQRGLGPLTPDFALLHGLVLGALSIGLILQARLRLGRAALISELVLAWIVWGGVEGVRILEQQLYDPVRPVARYLGISDQARPPAPSRREVVFVSPYPDPLGYYTWSRGRTWYQSGLSRNWSDVVRSFSCDTRWFQISKVFQPPLPIRQAEVGEPTDAATHAALLSWLRTNLLDITPQIESREGRQITTYLFKRPDGPCPAH